MFTDYYRQILFAEKDHFCPFEEKDRNLEPQNPLRSCSPWGSHSAKKLIFKVPSITDYNNTCKKIVRN